MDIASIDKVLTTTRSVRLRLDLERPVERDVIEECLNIAIQAPTGSNAQGWHFMVVTDAEKRAKIADYYRQAWKGYIAQSAEGQTPPSDREELRQVLKVVKSAQYLADNLQNAPVFVIPCIEGRVEEEGVVSQASLYGSILPAAWSFMLALRARGLGAAWTTLHLIYEKQVAEILGIPDNITQAALLPVAYYTGEDFRPAKRKPLDQLTHWDDWG
jgi:nitroreductase